MIINFKFEKNKNYKNPLEEGFDITKYQITDGKWTKHNLLWA